MNNIWIERGIKFAFFGAASTGNVLLLLSWSSVVIRDGSCRTESEFAACMLLWYLGAPVILVSLIATLIFYLSADVRRRAWLVAWLVNGGIPVVLVSIFYARC